MVKSGVAERISNYCLPQEYFNSFGPELIFSTNENISCHSAQVTSPGNYKKAWWHSFTLFHAVLSNRRDLSCFPLLASPLASSRMSQPTWQSTHSLSSLPSSRKDQPTWETTFTPLHWLFFTDSLSLFLSLSHTHTHTHTYFEQSAKHHEETTSNLWTIGVWEIIFPSFIFPSKQTDPRRNKLDIFQLLPWLQHFNSCSDDSISTPALTSAFYFLSWRQPLNSCSDVQRFYSFTTQHLSHCFLRLTAQRFLLSQTVNKTSKSKTINIFVNSFVLPFNITRGNRTLQPQPSFV